ncbi:hypothetical protein [Corynebacterium guangdongense]|uniref:Uncharacterized protein n=1 Tax=Corynebacterium guangdongense TaxID=1783348 RepID=A0ABU1ZWZ0_9CORY|nr:hypothetical protein [Corynebacterium guangdongense]MDR7329270.1 hypothetical protein [Corynebacterium guangdongense]WJZ17836.1 hypothetical protein CGUA_06325 [Corynebacterium guangdongense]
MTAPKPSDPRRPGGITPGEVDERLSRILGTPAATLADEAEQLEAAHDVLNQALQNN